jgi:UDP-N-acetylglucosamine--N-acetylmuramyl-(pentapeptide) pyrophosphoryl-undecaprenol N-acetylglucosamine transferase
MTTLVQPARVQARAATLSSVELTPTPDLRGLRVAFAGGGTGGHIVPGRHLLAHARGELGDVLWFATGRQVESNAFAGLERDLDGVACERVAMTLEPDGGGAPSLVRIATRSPQSTLAARAALRRHASEVVIGLGGFTCVPAVLAARSLGIPIVLLEINAARGKATRWLGSLSSRVCHAWRATLPSGGESERDRLTGPPLAPSFARGAPSDADSRSARAAEGFDAARSLLVVLGGSQGAGALNAFLREHIDALTSQRLQVLHQVGPGRLDQAAAPRAGYRAVEYLADVHRALSAATIVLCRGGASTLAEIGALRRPAWVVPYPHHADRHQERNARELGGVCVVAETRLGADFARELLHATSSAGAHELARMADALAGRVPLDAAQRIWSEVAALREQRLT